MANKHQKKKKKKKNPLTGVLLLVIAATIVRTVTISTSLLSSSHSSTLYFSVSLYSTSSSAIITTLSSFSLEKLKLSSISSNGVSETSSEEDFSGTQRVGLSLHLPLSLTFFDFSSWAKWSLNASMAWWMSLRFG